MDVSGEAGQLNGSRKRPCPPPTEDAKDPDSETSSNSARRRLTESESGGEPPGGESDAPLPSQERLTAQPQAGAKRDLHSQTSASLLRSVGPAASLSHSLNEMNSSVASPELQALLLQQAGSVPALNPGMIASATNTDPSTLILLQQQRQLLEREELLRELTVRGVVPHNGTLTGTSQGNLHGAAALGTQHRPPWNSVEGSGPLGTVPVPGREYGLPFPPGSPPVAATNTNTLLLNPYYQLRTGGAGAARAWQGNNGVTGRRGGHDEWNAMLRAVATGGVLPSGNAVSNPTEGGQRSSSQSLAEPDLFARAIGGALHPPVDMYMGCDDEVLSDHQVLLRRQIQFYEVSAQDIHSMTPGRRRAVAVGQVGIRCRHCAKLPLHERPKGSVYFPSTLRALYQAAQNMAASHFCVCCEEISEPVKQRLQEFQEAKAKAGHAGKKYWSDAAKVRGVVETEEGLRFAPMGERS